jgi:lipopolysaccharide biosynthesis protein
MLSGIPSGDLELNLAHPHGCPTLVPSTGLEQRLDLRLSPDWPAQEPCPIGQSLAIHLHVHYLDALKPLLAALNSSIESLTGCDLWVSTDSSSKAEAIRNTIKVSPMQAAVQQLEIRVCSNRGRNLGPLLGELWPHLSGYDLLLHLHGKRSVESDLGESWRQDLLATLLPDRSTLQGLRQSFAQNATLGLVMPQPPALIRPYLNWGGNFDMAALLAERLGSKLHRNAVLVFPAGMMFWCRPAALAPLARLCQALPELPPEPLAVDGTSLHALERLVVHGCEQAGFSWRLLCREPSGKPAELSVWKEQPAAYLEATALMAARLRQEHEQRNCAETNLARCSEQLERHITTADAQLRAADAQLRTLLKQVAERDQRLETMARSLSWRLTRPLRWLKRRAPAGT